MQQNDIFDFLDRINAYLDRHQKAALAGSKFELKKIGKSALLLAGLKNSIGTNDIDSLKVQSKGAAQASAKIESGLTVEFGRAKLLVNEYFLQLVERGFVFLRQRPSWVGIDQDFEHLRSPTSSRIV